MTHPVAVLKRLLCYGIRLVGPEFEPIYCFSFSASVLTPVSDGNRFRRVVRMTCSQLFFCQVRKQRLVEQIVYLLSL
jgi:hypothetical protein